MANQGIEKNINSSQFLSSLYNFYESQTSFQNRNKLSFVLQKLQKIRVTLSPLQCELAIFETLVNTLYHLTFCEDSLECPFKNFHQSSNSYLRTTLDDSQLRTLFFRKLRVKMNSFNETLVHSLFSINEISFPSNEQDFYHANVIQPNIILTTSSIRKDPFERVVFKVKRENTRWIHTLLEKVNHILNKALGVSQKFPIVDDMSKKENEKKSIGRDLAIEKSEQQHFLTSKESQGPPKEITLKNSFPEKSSQALNENIQSENYLKKKNRYHPYRLNTIFSYDEREFKSSENSESDFSVHIGDPSISNDIQRKFEDNFKIEENFLGDDISLFSLFNF